MYAIYGNIYHQYTPVLLAYIPYMDPMGYEATTPNTEKQHPTEVMISDPFLGGYPIDLPNRKINAQIVFIG